MRQVNGLYYNYVIFLRFRPSQVCEQIKQKGLKLGLVIDLTQTYRYYEGAEVIKFWIISLRVVTCILHRLIAKKYNTSCKISIRWKFRFSCLRRRIQYAY